MPVQGYEPTTPRRFGLVGNRQDEVRTRYARSRDEQRPGSTRPRPRPALSANETNLSQPIARGLQVGKVPVPPPPPRDATRTERAASCRTDPASSSTRTAARATARRWVGYDPRDGDSGRASGCESNADAGGGRHGGTAAAQLDAGCSHSIARAVGEHGRGR